MTPRRALWEAVVTVCMPSVVIWALIMYFFPGGVRADELPLFVFFIALPLPFIPLVAKHYRDVDKPRREPTWRSHIIGIIISVVGLAAFSVGSANALVNREGTWGLVSAWAYVFFFLYWLGSDIRGAARARRKPETPAQ